MAFTLRVGVGAECGDGGVAWFLDKWDIGVVFLEYRVVSAVVSSYVDRLDDEVVGVRH